MAAVDEAVGANDTPVPDEILEAFKVPSVECISFIPVHTAVYPPQCAAARQEQTQLALVNFAEQVCSLQDMTHALQYVVYDNMIHSRF